MMRPQGELHDLTADACCLTNTLNRYLDAVIKHEPSAAPLFVGFRQTENAVVVRLGTGVWKTMTALGKVQRRYLDPVTGQAAYFGIIDNNRIKTIYAAMYYPPPEAPAPNWPP